MSPWSAYLIHLDRPLGTIKHHAQFYLGITQDYPARFAQHQSGRGSKILAHAARNGIPFNLIRLWQFDTYQEARGFELWAKRQVKNHRKLLHVSPKATLREVPGIRS